MTRNTTLKISLKIFYREFCSAPVMLWVMSLFFAACICTALIGMTETLKADLSRNTSELVGGDLVISSFRPLSDIFLKTAKTNNLRYSESVRFFSMIQSTKEFRLVSVKAVDSFYPLLGQLEIASEHDRFQSKGPRRGEVWISARLAIELNVKPNDELRMGRATFKIGAIIEKEPDTAGRFELFAPRVLMHLEDVPLTAVIQPGSRISYRLYLKGASTSLFQYQTQIKGALNANVSVLKPEESNMAFKTFWRNIESLTSVAVLSTLLLTGIAVLMATRNYAINHRQHALLFKTLGATGDQVGIIFGFSFAWISLSALLPGTIVGYLILIVLKGQITLLPFILSLVLGLSIVFAFGFPIINRLKDLSPMQILQQSSNMDLSLHWVPMIGIFFVLIAAVYMIQGQINLLAIVGLALLYASIVICGLHFGLLHLLRKTLGCWQGVWRLALRNILARGSDSVLQVLIFTLIFTMIGLNYGLLHSALNKWISELPPDTPNYFILNIATQDVSDLKQQLADNKVQPIEIFSIVRGHLTHINRQPTSEIQRPLNLTSMFTLPKDNQVVIGPAWINYPKNAISVELSIANRLNLKLGDTLRFLIEDEVVEGNVFNIRSVVWGSFKPNFYFIFDESRLKDFSATAMTSFYLPKNNEKLIAQLINSFPEVSVIDIGDTLESITELMAKLENGLTSLLAAMCMIGLAAWLGSLWLTLKARETEQALLSTLGSDYASLLKINLLEFGFYGITVGLLSLSLSTAICQYVATRFLDIAYEMFSLTTVVQFGLIVIVFLCVGTLFSRRIQSVSPMILLSK